MENGSPVRFHLEEQVNLREKISEADIVSLDVQPDIEVLEQDQLVIIKGDLILSGHFQSPELRASEEREDELSTPSTSSFQNEEAESDISPPSIWSVTERFPIDITVPAHKVSRLDDVYLHVEQLDYTIDEHNRLNVEVEIALLGVENGLKIDRNGVELEEQDQIFAAAEREEVTRGEETKKEDEPVFDFEKPEQIPAMEQPVLAAEENFLRDGSEDEREADSTEEEATEAKAQEVLEVQANGMRSELKEEETESHKVEENGAVVEQEKTGGVAHKVVSFLSKLLAGKEEASTQKATLKMCIVQRNETLEQIAERYQVSVEEIIRFNRLASDQISPGDIMYIPIKRKKGEMKLLHPIDEEKDDHPKDN